jgi:hypothetical protein
MVTPKGSMSTEGEIFQASVLPYRCSICPPCCVSVLVVVQPSSEVPEGLMNYPVYYQNIPVNVKITLEQATKTQKGSRIITLLLL